MFCVVLLMAVVIVAINPQPPVQFCLVESRVVVARALEPFSCRMGDVTLTLILLEFDAAVARVSALATVAAAILVPLTVVFGGGKHERPTVELIAPRIVVA